MEDGNRAAQVVAGSFIGTFIRSDIRGVVRGERELEEDPVHDVLGALCGGVAIIGSEGGMEREQKRMRAERSSNADETNRMLEMQCEGGVREWSESI